MGKVDENESNIEWSEFLESLLQILPQPHRKQMLIYHPFNISAHWWTLQMNLMKQLMLFHPC